MGDLFSGIGFLFEQVFTRPIFNVLLLLYRLFGDFGLSIVVLTLIVKLILFPLTLQQLKSTKANQALQPQLQEIRRKYAKDQRAQMEATQALYKEYGINPMAGCLPLLVQLPVLYGMYFAFSTVLRSSHLLQDVNVGLKYPFIASFNSFDVNLTWFTWLKFLQPAWPWWISLAQPDPTHILPIIAALATFIQLRMSLPKVAASAIKVDSGQFDPTTSTMKTMQYIMPFFTLFITWNFPSGLALYWTVSSIFQAVQQYFVTGWGSLLIMPNFLSKNDGDSSTKSGSNKRESALRKENSREESSAEGVSDTIVAAASSSGAIASKMRTTTGGHSGNSGLSTQSTTRRSRNTSASARRRSGTQRARR